ncbi:MAG: hypothetical protein IAE91_00840 [Ignavibacteriaceae bacterium]|nr:hypothetical protein [Ignavibacteriaceae bacterium]
MRFLKISFQLVLLFILIGCNSEPTSTPPTSQLHPHWEVMYGKDTIIDHHFGLKIDENAGILTGTAEYIGNDAKYSGTISGSVTGNNINFLVNFENDNYDFSFKGVVSNSLITGKMHFTNAASIDKPSLIYQDTLDVALIKSNNAVFDFGAAPPPNQYYFKKVFSSSKPNPTPVIFVHGMGATPAEWDSILANFSQNFKDKHDVYVYQYNWQDSIMINGRILKDSVQAYGLVNPIIVAHSMGGLVSRAYVASGGSIEKLVTLGTPHKGTELANFLFIKPDLDTPGPNDMAIGSSFITGLFSNPNDLTNRNKYYVFAGQMGGRFETSFPFSWVWNEPYYKEVLNGIVCTGWKVLIAFGANDGLVPVTSALFEGGGVNQVLSGPILWVDHMHLVFPSKAPEVMNYINSL